ncbi:hypothetical protein ACQ4LE_007441 [Meloidogyne hapla]
MLKAAKNTITQKYYELITENTTKTKKARKSINTTNRICCRTFLFETFFILFSIIIVSESATFQRVHHYIERRSQKIEGTNLNLGKIIFSEDDNVQNQEDEAEQQENKESIEIIETCDIYANEQLHALMDRICELCHDMYSHQRPNMRADCRSGCFRNEDFKRCLRLFRPINNLIDNKSRKSRSIKQMTQNLL